MIVEKSKDRPKWEPSTLAAVTLEDIHNKFFPSHKRSNYESLRAHIPTSLHSLAHTLPKPSRFALPTEDEISRLVQGSHEASGSTALTVQELVERLEKQKHGKHGVVAKVMETITRKCEEDDDGYISWYH